MCTQATAREPPGPTNQSPVPACLGVAWGFPSRPHALPETQQPVGPRADQAWLGQGRSGRAKAGAGAWLDHVSKSFCCPRLWRLC